jgi:sulfite reductase alpha subunit-like flavoprotein
MLYVATRSEDPHCGMHFNTRPAHPFAIARLLTAPGSDRAVVHCELDVGDSGIRFTAGDAVCVVPQVRAYICACGPHACCCHFCLVARPPDVQRHPRHASNCSAPQSTQQPNKPQNDPELVESLLARLELSGDAVFEVRRTAAAASSGQGADTGGLLHNVECPCTLRAALARGFDVARVPKKSLLRVLGEYCDDAAEKR